MNLALPAGGTSFTLIYVIYVAGQGPRNPRALRELRNVGEKRPRIRQCRKSARVGQTEKRPGCEPSRSPLEKKAQRADFWPLTPLRRTPIP